MSGCIITLDGLGTQVGIAQQIVTSQADYILPVKDNQGSLYQDIAILFDGFEEENYVDVACETAKQVSQGHDRREIRQCWVVNVPKYLSLCGVVLTGLASAVSLSCLRSG